MKTIIVFLLIFIGLSFIYAQQYSDITYGAGTSLEIQAGADVCATNIYITGTYTGGGTICSGALPVTLISFEARITINTVKLIWITENEINNSGFDIERKKTEGSWEKISFVQGRGNTNGQSVYFYEDKKRQPGIYQYRLKQIDFNSNFEYYALNGDVIIKAPVKFDLSQNYPNPSNPKSKIDYQIPLAGKVTLKIYDMLGQEIVTLVNELKDAGYHTAEFDGSNLSSGVYFYKITASEFTAVKKMILVK